MFGGEVGVFGGEASPLPPPPPPLDRTLYNKICNVRGVCQIYTCCDELIFPGGQRN